MPYLSPNCTRMNHLKPDLVKCFRDRATSHLHMEGITTRCVQVTMAINNTHSTHHIHWTAFLSPCHLHVDVRRPPKILLVKGNAVARQTTSGTVQANNPTFMERQALGKKCTSDKWTKNRQGKDNTILCFCTATGLS